MKKLFIKVNNMKHGLFSSIIAAFLLTCFIMVCELYNYELTTLRLLILSAVYSLIYCIIYYVLKD